MTSSGGPTTRGWTHEWIVSLGFSPAENRVLRSRWRPARPVLLNAADRSAFALQTLNSIVA